MSSKVEVVRPYSKPDLIGLGRVADHTGHCSTGCDHDSVVHPDEFKKAELE
jgi:hypothetical protein